MYIDRSQDIFMELTMILILSLIMYGLLLAIVAILGVTLSFKVFLVLLVLVVLLIGDKYIWVEHRDDIENPLMPDRTQWLNDYVWTEYTITEIANGLPFKNLTNKL